MPGRDGELTLSGMPSYEAMVLECECMVPSVDKISAAAAWLTGRGDLVLGNDPTYAYDAQVIDEIRFEKILRGHAHRRFTVPFLCHPLKKAASTESNIELTSSGERLTISVMFPAGRSSKSRAAGTWCWQLGPIHWPLPASARPS